MSVRSDSVVSVMPRRRRSSRARGPTAAMTVDPTVFVLSEGWRDLVEFRDVVLQKDYYREYVRISEDAYAAPRIVTVLDAF